MDMNDDDDDDEEEGHEEEDEGADEPFFDTRSPSTSPDASVRGGGGGGGGREGGSDFDTEEDPMGPDTPGLTPRTAYSVGKGDIRDAFNNVGGRRVGDDDDQDEEDNDDDEDDDDDDWVDPSCTTPLEPSLPTKIQAPVMVQTHSNSSSSSSSSGVKVKSHSKNKKSAAAAAVKKKKPIAVVPPHFPFPSSTTVEDTPQQEDFQQRVHEVLQENGGTKLQRMHTARARDGGRTQSGGVKGVLTTEDSGENF